MRVLIVLGTIILIALAAAPSVILPARAVCAPPEPGFIIEPDTDSLELLPGASGTSIITVTSIDGFTGIVGITNTPTGPITAVPVSTTIDLTTAVTGTFTLTVTVDAAADPDTYFVSVDGESGFLFDSALVFVEVPGPDFSIEADTLFLTLGPGAGTNTSTVTLTSKNLFAGTVSLTKTVSPATGPTATLSEPSVTLAAGGSKDVVLTVASTASTPVGGYTVSIEGTASSAAGPITRSTLVFVLVKGPDFIMSADPFFLTVIPGGDMNSSVITVESILGFSGTVTLTLVPPPPYPGFSVTLAPTTVPVGPGAPATATLTVSAASPFTGPIPFLVVHVMGTGEDGRVRSTFVFVEVLIPNIEVRASPDSLPLASGISSITVKSLYGFEGLVMLTAASFDTCLEVSLSDPSVTVPLGGSVTSTLTIIVDPTTPPGTYYVDVSGTSPSSVFVGDSAVVTVGEDTTSPTWPPGSLTPSAVGETSVTLSWPVATDNVAIESYDILQDGVVVATVLAPTTTTTITGLSASTTYDFQVVAYDAAGNSAPGPTATVTTASPVNDPPVLSAIGSKEVDEGVLLTFTALASDPEGDSLTFSFGPGAPSGASISSGGVFTWTPTEAQGPGPYSVTVIVTDNGSPAMSDSETITITVADVNTAPILAAIGDKVVQETTTIGFTATASDSDIPANALTFSLGPATTGDFPEGATISPAGTFSWTPTADQGPGTYRARITVSDGSAADFEEITITVSETPVNNPPVLASIGNKQVNEGAPLSFTVTATDPDTGQTVTLSASGVPPGATFNTATGQFSWTPTEAQGQGTFSVTFTATDNGTPSRSASETITITVSEVNQAPVLPAIAGRTVTQGSQLTFTITANDPDIPPTLTYSLEPGAPTGASITASGGVFSWTPAANQEPGTYTITVRVTDGTAFDTETFTVTVSAPQQAPTAPRPFLEEYWYVLLIGALVLVGIPVAMKVRGKPGPKS